MWVDSMSSEPTVFIVDDDEAVGQSLRWLLESVGLRVEVFQSASAFISGYDPSRVGCLVLDVRMPGMSGLELQERLKEKQIGIPVIFITGHGDVPMAVRAMKAGAVDFIEKPFKDQELLDQIHRAIAQDLENRRSAAQRAALLERFHALTPREQEVMRLVAEGNPNKVIAYRLGLSSKTVEAHRARVMEKMQAKSLSDLVRMALDLDKLGSL